MYSECILTVKHGAGDTAMNAGVCYVKLTLFIKLLILFEGRRVQCFSQTQMSY